jgi:hypothetical protein
VLQRIAGMIKGLLLYYLLDAVLPAAIYPFHNSYYLGETPKLSSPWLGW